MNTEVTNYDNIPFSPFTPNTLGILNSEISIADREIKDLLNKDENIPLSNKDKERLALLLEEHEYFVNKHKNHL